MQLRALWLLCAGCTLPSPTRDAQPERTETPSVAATPSANPSALAVSSSSSAPAAEHTDYPLHLSYPALRTSVPRLPLATRPTPIEERPSLARELGVGRLFVKRDDQSGAYGGSKARKLELFLADATRLEKKHLVTIGGVGSNQAVASALFGAAHGFKVTLLLMPEPASPHVRDHLLADVSLGAELVLVPSYGKALKIARQRETEGAYFIPAGGTSPLGNAAFVNAAFELRDQIQQGLLPVPDRIYIAMGTMGSAVGLSIGLMAAGLPTQVIGVRASSEPTSSQKKLEQAFAETVQWLRALEPSFPALVYDPARLRIEGEFLGRGYAQPSEAGASAARVAETHGLELDPTYTEKAFAALRHDAPRLGDKTIVFWLTQHVGAQPRGPGATSLPGPFRGYDRNAAAKPAH